MMRVDVNSWLNRVKKAQAAQMKARVRAIRLGIQIVQKEAIKNVSGPAYGMETGPRGGQHFVRGPKTNAGELPVPVQLAQLRRAIKNLQAGEYGIVYADETIAPYAPHVHDGTKLMEARPFMSEATSLKRDETLAVMADVIGTDVCDFGLGLKK